jgi:hypothetical protein
MNFTLSFIVSFNCIIYYYLYYENTFMVTEMFGVQRKHLQMNILHGTKGRSQTGAPVKATSPFQKLAPHPANW